MPFPYRVNCRETAVPSPPFSYEETAVPFPYRDQL